MLTFYLTVIYLMAAIGVVFIVTALSFLILTYFYDIKLNIFTKEPTSERSSNTS